MPKQHKNSLYICLIVANIFSVIATYSILIFPPKVLPPDARYMTILNVITILIDLLFVFSGYLARKDGQKKIGAILIIIGCYIVLLRLLVIANNLSLFASPAIILISLIISVMLTVLYFYLGHQAYKDDQKTAGAMLIIIGLYYVSTYLFSLLAALGGAYHY